MQRDKLLRFLEKSIETALIGEVTATPKPGLVDRKDNGAHSDMCYETFIDSTYAILPFLVEMGEAGYEEKKELEVCFPKIRRIGLQAELKMFQVTKGINTHKGAIFSLGILVCAAGWFYRRQQTFDVEGILKIAGEMTGTVLKREFDQMSTRSPQTNGERLFADYGEKGIRGEAQQGFPSVKNISLSLMRSAYEESKDVNNIHLNILLALMERVVDTNVLNRGGYAALHWIQKQAGEVLQLGGAFTSSGMEAIVNLNTRCIEKNISPGGCADLLAATIFCGQLEQSY